MSTENKYRSILFLLLSTLLKYALIGGVVGTVALGIIERKRLFSDGITSLIGGLLAFFLIGCVFGIMFFLFAGLKSGRLQEMGEQGLFFGAGIMLGGSNSYGFLVMLILWVFRLLLIVFYAVAFMPTLIAYYAIMSIIEIFVEIPESIGDITDHLPKVVSVLLVIFMVLKLTALI